MNKGWIAFAALAFAGPAAAGNVIRVDDGTRYTVTDRVQKSYEVGTHGSVEVWGIGGSVEVRAGEGGTVAVDYHRRARTKADLDCERVVIEHDAGIVRVHVERDRRRDCEVIYAGDDLTLVVPRNASVSLSSIGDSVKVEGVLGMLRLASVGDSAQLDGVQQAMVDSVGDSVRMRLTGLASAGVRVSSVGDRVVLNMPERLGARLEIDSVGDRVRGLDLQGDWHDGPGAVRTTLGGGGPLISISSVGDEVVIER